MTIYVDRRIQTVWKEENSAYKCAVIGALCRGCSGLSYKYPYLFGGCDKPVICPNCRCLTGPKSFQDWSDIIELDMLFTIYYKNGVDEGATYRPMFDDVVSTDDEC
jgi:hypothetical protein